MRSKFRSEAALKRIRLKAKFYRDNMTEAQREHRRVYNRVYMRKYRLRKAGIWQAWCGSWA
jgi:hypothetical protein